MAIRRRGPKKWEVVVYLGRDPATGKPRQRSRIVHGTLKAARAKQDQMSSDALDEQDPSPTVTFAELARRWTKVARHEVSTRSRTESYLTKHINPELGTVPVADIRPADLDRFYLTLEAGGLAPSTIARVHGIVRAALEQAVTWEWIGSNPARRARPPEIPSPSPVIPSLDDVARLFAAARAADPEFFAFLRLVGATGMRPGSVCGIRRSDIDLPGAALRHHRAIGLGKGQPYEKATKSGGRHTLALGPYTIPVLRWHLWRMRVRARALDQELARDAYLFSHAADGTVPWRPDHVSKRFRRLARLAGVTFELRSLRHFHATTLLSAGVDIKTISGRLTHARTSTTLDRYQGHVPASDRVAAAAIDLVLGRQKVVRENI